jgi:tyrosyl-tRNA synthetase
MSGQTAGNNASAITTQLSTLFRTACSRGAELVKESSGAHDPTILNNADWHGQVSLMDFLREVGSARVNTMLSKERSAGSHSLLNLRPKLTICTYSMRARMNADAGLTFSEMTYQLLQARDYLHLYRTERCDIQLGGQDQWGNIVAGMDLIRRHHSMDSVPPEVFALTTPLLTTPTGEKFGKSAGNAVWLDPTMTAPFELYQVGHYLGCGKLMMLTPA